MTAAAQTLPFPIIDQTPMRERIREAARRIARPFLGSHLRLGGVLVIDKWRPADLERKFAVEAELIAALDARPEHDHRGCGAPNARGNREVHVLGRHCEYALVHERALAALAALGIHPLERVRVRNSLVNTGLTDYNNGLSGGSLTTYSNANAGIGAGDSAAAVAVAQVDLQALTGATHRYINALDGTFPTVSNGLLTFRATFATGNGNFAWAEVVFTNNTANLGTTNNLTRILNRFLTSPGTKTSAQSWQVTGTMTLS